MNIERAKEILDEAEKQGWLDTHMQGRLAYCTDIQENPYRSNFPISRKAWTDGWNYEADYNKET
jgi:hypothetical protein